MLLSVTGLTVPGKLDHVSFALRSGEIVGVVGLAGSGRSTFLKALSGAVPSYGQMLIDGGPVRAGRSRKRSLRAIFRLPEDRRTEGLLLDHSLALNVVLANLKGVSSFGVYRRGRARAIVSDFCRDLDIRHRDVTHPVRVLSGGNQQKAMLARALFVNPRVLLLDEPTFGVDVGASEDIVRFAREFCVAGGAVVWVSSDFAEMSQVVDRVVVLAGGRISTPKVDRNPSDPLREDDLLNLLAVA
jgi:ribose transport system ATP-binding protein